MVQALKNMGYFFSNFVAFSGNINFTNLTEHAVSICVRCHRDPSIGIRVGGQYINFSSIF